MTTRNKISRRTTGLMKRAETRKEVSVRRAAVTPNLSSEPVRQDRIDACRKLLDCDEATLNLKLAMALEKAMTKGF